MTEYDDPTEVRAHQLRVALQMRGLRGVVPWDCSPWGLRISLIDAPSSPATIDAAAALFVRAEYSQSAITFGELWVWVGQLADVGEDHDLLTGTSFQWVEHHRDGDPVGSLADQLVPFVNLLRLGAAGYLAVPIRTPHEDSRDAVDPTGLPPLAAVLTSMPAETPTSNATA